MNCLYPMKKEYSNQFPIGKKPVGNKQTKLYNIEIWNNSICIRNIYLNAPYAVCVMKKKELVRNGTIERRIRIVPIA